MQTKDDLIRSLVHWLAQGKLDAQQVLPALQQLAEPSTPPCSLLELLESLASKPEPGWGPLQRHLRETCWRLALNANASRTNGRVPEKEATLALLGLPWNAPLQWRAGLSTESVESALRAAEDWLLVQAHGNEAPVTRDLVRNHVRRAAVAAVKQLQACGGILEAGWLQVGSAESTPSWPQQVLETLRQQLDQLKSADTARAEQAVAQKRVPLPEEVNEAAALEHWRRRWQQASDDAGRRSLLDLLCSWPSAQAAATILEVAQPGWMQERAQLILTLRFGKAWLNSWNAWRQWLAQADREWQQEASALAALARANAPAVLWLWFHTIDSPDPATLQWLQDRMVERLRADCWQRFAARWTSQIPANERICFGLPAEIVPSPSEAPPVIVQPRATDAGTTAPAPAPARQRRAEPPPLPASAAPPPPLPTAPERPPAAPRGPSIWEEHIQPFFAANWYFLAGIGMVIVGSSLVAFYTWDKHWLVRYTIMPALLAFFTWTLARVGQWIEQRGAQFKATGATLRGAAIGLLPVNFMAMGLLSGDPGVARKGLAMSVMALFYLGFFGWGLRRWCGAVHPALSNGLGGALLLLNALVAVGPLARTLGGVQGESLVVAHGGGIPCGVLPRGRGSGLVFPPDADPRAGRGETGAVVCGGDAGPDLPAGVRLGARLHAAHAARSHTYAPAMILAGWLVLFAERCGAAVSAGPRQHGAESFLGFALVLLGLLMGAAQPQVRILAFRPGGSGVAVAGAAARASAPLLGGVDSVCRSAARR